MPRTHVAGDNAEQPDHVQDGDGNGQFANALQREEFAAAHEGRPALRDIAATHSHGRVLVVAHNTLIRLALCSLFSIPMARYRTVFPGVRNGALTEIGFEEENAALLQYNSPLGTAGGLRPANQTS